MTPRAVLAAIAALAVCLPAGAGARERPSAPRGRGYANPSALVAAEIAFAQLAQAKGQWSAFRETAAPEADMFVPRRVAAQAWLKKRANPPAAVRWQPHEVWMSCDGSYGVTRGAWQGAGGGTGYFTTIWQRQEKGGYKWVLDQGDALAQPLAAPEMIAGRVADCRPGAGSLPVPSGLPVSPPLAGVDEKSGSSRDRTLQWSSSVHPDGSRSLGAWLWNGTSFDAILNLQVAAAPAG